jgi:outer membrane protein
MTGKQTLSVSMLGLALGLGLLFAGSAQAQAPTGTKVGVASIQDIITGTNEGQQAFAALDQRFSPRKAELENLNNEIVRLTADLQKTGDKLSDEERANRARTIETKKKTLQRSVDDAQAEYQQAEQEIVNRVGAKLLEVIKKFGQDNGYATILDTSTAQNPILWAEPSAIITKQLIDAYNAQSNVAAPAKPAGSTPPRPTPATPKRP